jgi:Holliday junction resolvasome RuvABC endonuclease subunit
MNPNEARTLAFDPGTRHVGWCLGVDNEYEQSGVYDTKGDDADERIRDLMFWAISMLEDLKPDIVYIEEPAGDNGNRATDRKLARAWQAIASAVYIVFPLAANVEIIRVYPSQVKSTDCSKDNPGFAEGFANKRPIGPDEADAIGTWIFGQGLLKARWFKRLAEVH